MQAKSKGVYLLIDIRNFLNNSIYFVNLLRPFISWDCYLFGLSLLHIGSNNRDSTVLLEISIDVDFKIKLNRDFICRS